MSFDLYYLHKDRMHTKSELYSEIRCVIKMDMYNAYSTYASKCTEAQKS